MYPLKYILDIYLFIVSSAIEICKDNFVKCKHSWFFLILTNVKSLNNFVVFLKNDTMKYNSDEKDTCNQYTLNIKNKIVVWHFILRFPNKNCNTCLFIFIQLLNDITGFSLLEGEEEPPSTSWKIAYSPARKNTPSRLPHQIVFSIPFSCGYIFFLFVNLVGYIYIF